MYSFSLIISLEYSTAKCGWSMTKSWGVHVMWVGERVLCLLQDLFKQGKSLLTLTLTWGNCKGSCNDYNWNSWAPFIALHTSRNVARLKRLKTIQVIEPSAVANACKKSTNSYCWSQVIMKGVYQEDYKIPIHSLWHAIEVLPQPSYVTSSCKSAIVTFALWRNRCAFSAWRTLACRN